MDFYKDDAMDLKRLKATLEALRQFLPLYVKKSGTYLLHTLPNIKKGAVPLEKHSPMLGHRDSSQTVLREYFLKTCCVSNKTSF